MPHLKPMPVAIIYAMKYQGRVMCYHSDNFNSLRFDFSSHLEEKDQISILIRENLHALSGKDKFFKSQQT